MVATGDGPEDEPRPTARAKKVARRAAAPLVARLRTSAAEAVNPELQAARREVGPQVRDLTPGRLQLGVDRLGRRRAQPGDDGRGGPAGGGLGPD